VAITEEEVITLVKKFHDVVMLDKGTAAEQAVFFLHPEPRIFIPHGEDVTLRTNYEIHQKLMDEKHAPLDQWEIIPLSSQPERVRAKAPFTGKVV
jgi:hypothetical protein